MSYKLNHLRRQSRWTRRPWYKPTRRMTGDDLKYPIDLADRFPPVFDQQLWGTCYSNAMAGIMGYLLRLRGISFIPSRLFIAYNSAVKAEGGLEEDGIAQNVDVFKATETYGVCAEDLDPQWHYDAEALDVCPPDTCYRFAVFYRSEPAVAIRQTEADLIACLHEGMTPMLGMQVWPQMQDGICASNGMISTPNWLDRLLHSPLGCHDVVIVGYDPTKKLLKIRNSWGPKWGDDGHGYLPLDYFTNTALCFDVWATKGIV